MKGFGETTTPETEAIAKAVVDSAYHVFRTLGPGLLESVYETCLFHELTVRGLSVRRQVQMPIRYRDVSLESGLVIDLLVEDEIIIELKAVEKLQPVHHAQLMSYLKLAQRRLGLLINFKLAVFNDGIKRVVL